MPSKTKLDTVPKMSIATSFLVAHHGSDASFQWAPGPFSVLTYSQTLNFTAQLNITVFGAINALLGDQPAAWTCMGVWETSLLTDW